MLGMFAMIRTFLQGSITLEPAIFALQLGRLIVDGAQVQTDLLLWKICHLEFNYTDEVCHNLALDENDAINNIVQTRANNFLMVTEWLTSGPALVFSLFAGSLMDSYGCKPFILLPLGGLILSSIGVLLNYAFIYELPLEFFYIDTIYAFFGGKSVFYLGVYGYGALISRPENRASLLARFDGFEVIASILGTVLSPIIVANIGQYGNFGFRLAFTTLAFFYVLIFVKDPPLKSEIGKPGIFAAKNPLKLFKNVFIRPIYEMLRAIFKVRPFGIHYLVAIQYYMFSTYWFVIEEKALQYLYMLKAFDGFDARQFSFYSLFTNGINALGLLLILPVLSSVCKMHDALLLCLVLTTEALGLLATAFSHELWQLYLATGLQLMGFCKYSLVRALLSQCIEPTETGKMFSALAILAALMPIVSNPIFRQLYNHTLETFPAAEILLASAILATSAILNFVVYTQKARLKALKFNRQEALEINQESKL